MDPIVHEGYDGSLQYSHDIALLKLAEDVDLATYTPACLPPKDANYAGKTASVYGWGKTKDEARPIDGCPKYNLSPVLKETTQTIITNNACKQSSGTILRCENGVVIEYGPVSMNSLVLDDVVCGIKSGQGSCYGDSGGPFTVEEDGQHTLVGVVNGALACARVSTICYGS